MAFSIFIGIFILGFLFMFYSSGCYVVKEIRRIYLHKQIISIDPFNLHYYPKLFDNGFSPINDSVRVLFYGDSRAEQWVYPVMGNEFQYQNRAIGGQTTAQLLGRFDIHVVPLKPDIIILQLGINDLKTIPFLKKDTELIALICKSNILRLLEKCQELGCHIILTTIFPPGYPSLIRKIFWSNQVSQAVKRINSRIKQISFPKIIIFDTYDILAGDDGIVRKEFQKDLLHLNDDGYSVLNEELIKILRSKCYPQKLLDYKKPCDSISTVPASLL